MLWAAEGVLDEKREIAKRRPESLPTWICATGQ